MSLIELPRDDNGRIMLQTDREFAIWDKYKAEIQELRVADLYVTPETRAEWEE